MEDFWLKNTYRAIKHFSDIDIQRKAWSGNDKEYLSSYDEDRMVLFDDNNFDEFIAEWEKENCDYVLLQDFKKFRDMLNLYNIRRPLDVGKGGEKILNDPEWKKVIEQAKKTIDDWDHISD